MNVAPMSLDVRLVNTAGGGGSERCLPASSLTPSPAAGYKGGLGERGGASQRDLAHLVTLLISKSS